VNQFCFTITLVMLFTEEFDNNLRIIYFIGEIDITLSCIHLVTSSLLISVKLGRSMSGIGVHVNSLIAS